MTTSVFITGANGFIAQHIVSQLLKQSYKVIGSVRSAAKGDKLKKQLNNDNFSYEIVEKLEAPGAFDNALKAHPEVSVFLHTASPFSFQVEDIDRDILIPAVDGTVNALKSVKEHGHNVKKVVLTSSALAMFNVARPKMEPLTENSWSDMTREEALSNPMFGYCASKGFAEKAAWDFVEKEKPSFALTALNPVWVFGPQLFDEDAKGTVNTSNSALLSVLQLKPEDDVPPPQGGNFVDVRDAALAHVRAVENNEVNGRRVLVSSDPWSPQIAVNSIRKQFPQLNLPKGNPDDKPFGAQGDVDLLTKTLGVSLTSWDTLIHDTVKQYLAANN